MTYSIVISPPMQYTKKAVNPGATALNFFRFLFQVADVFYDRRLKVRCLILVYHFLLGQLVEHGIKCWKHFSSFSLVRGLADLLESITHCTCVILVVFISFYCLSGSFQRRLVISHYILNLNFCSP